MANNNKLNNFDDPYMGMEGQNNEFLGSGDSSLLGQPAAPQQSPSDVLNAFNFFDMGNDAPAQAPAQAAPIPQPDLDFDAALDNLLTGDQDVDMLQGQQPFPSAVQNNEQYPFDFLQGNVGLANQQAVQAPEQYPLDTLLGGNGANPAGLGNPFAFGMATAPPNNSQSDFLNMQPQYVAQGQAYGAPNMGFQGNGYVQPPVPDVQMQGYLPAQAQDAFQPQPAAPVQPQPLRNPPVHVGGMITHNRKLKFDPENDPSQYYTKPTGLGPWGPMISRKGKAKTHLFQYFRESAELIPLSVFNKKQLVLFFRGIGHPNPSRNLTLWIQNSPAQAIDRYAAGGNSGKCRFEDCSGASRTINKGWFRVAFDEASDLTGHTNDPLQNAGYMHLHCFEKHFDLGYLIHYGAARLGFQIRPDTRHFPYETRNPMALNRDHLEMLDTYNEWVAEQKVRADRIEVMDAGVPLHQRYTGFDPHNRIPHNQRLGFKLVEKHLALEVSARSAIRDRRGGIHIGIHKGDLDLYEAKRLERKDKKRKAREVEEEEEEEEEEEGEAEAAEDETRVAIGDDDQEEAMPRGTRSRPARNTPSPNASASASAPKSKKAKTAHTPANTNNDVDTDMLIGDDSYNSSPQHSSARQAQPQPQPPFNGLSFPAIFQPLQLSFPTAPAGPRTRKRSRETGQDILTQLASGPHLTRSGAHAIQSRLDTQPQHVRQQILSAVPDYMAMVLDSPAPGQQQGYPAVYHDLLEERVGRLPKRQRREVEEFVEKRERRKGGRKGHSV